MRHLLAEQALLPSGWSRDVLFTIDDAGLLAAVQANAILTTSDGAVERLSGPVAPGMPNLHSHAFQRAMAGLAERAERPEDSFWSWRDLMYRLVGKITPEQAEAIAAHLYVEMLKGGYTSVAEFHYLHHDRDGSAYANRAEMADRIAAAAGRAGLGLTLLPVLYAHAGFGGKPPTEGQRRFINDIDGFLKLHAAVRDRHDGQPGRTVGLALHSLRAVTPEEMAAVLAAVPDNRPIHIHIAEQQQEVEDCIAWSGQRPIEWLYDNAEVGPNWCLVHATHANPNEVARMAASKAVVGLCPTTEANLGDGIFPAIAHQTAGGLIGIGSDSHVCLDIAEELRWLEYGQRLVTQRRTRLADGKTSVGGTLYRAALAGGAAASGLPVGGLAVGKRADLVVLDASHPFLAAEPQGDAILDRWIFGGNGGMVRHVMAGGDWVVRDRRHKAEEQTAAAFTKALREMLAE